jgi:hypothetical protein
MTGTDPSHCGIWEGLFERAILKHVTSPQNWVLQLTTVLLDNSSNLIDAAHTIHPKQVVIVRTLQVCA